MKIKIKTFSSELKLNEFVPLYLHFKKCRKFFKLKENYTRWYLRSREKIREPKMMNMWAKILFSHFLISLSFLNGIFKVKQE